MSQHKPSPEAACRGCWENWLCLAPGLECSLPHEISKYRLFQEMCRPESESMARGPKELDHNPSCQLKATTSRVPARGGLLLRQIRLRPAKTPKKFALIEPLHKNGVYSSVPLFWSLHRNVADATVLHDVLLEEILCDHSRWYQWLWPHRSSYLPRYLREVWLERRCSSRGFERPHRR